MRLRFVYAYAFILVSLGTVTSSCSARPGAHEGSLQTVSAVDDSIFYTKVGIAKAQGIDRLPIGEAVAAVGKLFLGSPYVGGTLDRDSVSEALVVDLKEFDCVTFYESSLALARTLKLHAKPTIEDYQRQLAYMRYRGGTLSGFASRLHYTSDYFFDASTKHVLKPMTRIVAADYGKQDVRPINFMTTHRDRYKQLRAGVAADREYQKIVAAEANIASRGGYWYIPKADVERVEAGIATGDIIGITTNINGLDCSHTGIAIRMPDGRVHFMHASSLHHEVIISDEPLAEYLTHSNSQTGIIVNRPLEPTHE